MPTPSCVPYGNHKPVCKEHPYHAFVWSNGTMTDLGTLGSGNFSAGEAINLSGEVAGWSDTNADTGQEAVVWNGKKWTGLGVPLDSMAAGINDSGQVVGSWSNATTGSQPFLDSNGTITDLPEPGFVATSNLGCQADAINNNAQIAGTCWGYNSKLASLYADMVLWQNGTVTDLGTLGGARSAATAINDNGVMVGGQYIDSGGTITNLNTLIPAGSPTIQNATAINNNGQIVANDGHALLLTPA